MQQQQERLSNIRNVQSFMDNTPDWAWLNGVFTNKRIKVTDGDGMVERAGNLLILEVKSPGKELPLGQAIMYSNLSKAGTATVIVLWGKNDTYNKMRVYTATGKYRDYEDIDNDRVIETIQQWEIWALRNPKVNK